MAEDKPPVRFDGLCVIDDGYTLVGVLQDSAGELPKVEVRYRPALPEVLYDYRLKDRTTGQAQLNAVIEILDSHVESWSGVFRRSPTGPVPVKWAKGLLAEPAVRRAIGANYIDQMFNLVVGFTPGRWEEELKNS